MDAPVIFGYDQIARRCEFCYEDGIKARATRLASDAPIVDGQLDGFLYLCLQCSGESGLDHLYDIVFRDQRIGVWDTAVPAELGLASDDDGTDIEFWSR